MITLADGKTRKTRAYRENINLVTSLHTNKRSVQNADLVNHSRRLPSMANSLSGLDFPGGLESYIGERRINSTRNLRDTRTCGGPRHIVYDGRHGLLSFIVIPIDDRRRQWR